MPRKKDNGFRPDDINKTATRLAEVFVDADVVRPTLVRAIHTDVAAGHWFPTDAETDVILTGEGARLLASFPALNAAMQAAYTRP